MSDQFIRKAKQQLTIQDIILQHLKEILAITRIEFRSKGGYYNESYEANRVIKTWIPDQRLCYIQSVESFAHVLIPFYDEEMEKDFQVLIKKFQNLKQDIINEKITLIKVPASHEDYQYERTQAQAFNNDDQQELVNRQLVLMKNLFQKLNLLLKRRDYLKSAEYTEAEDMGDEEEE